MPNSIPENAIYRNYPQERFEQIAKAYPVIGDWVYHVQPDGSLEKHMFIGVWKNG